MFNKKRSLLFALLSLLFSYGWCAEVSKDVNGDNKTDIDDAKVIAEAILNGTTDVTKHDIDGNGKVDVGDIIKLLDYIKLQQIDFGGDNGPGKAEAKERE